MIRGSPKNEQEDRMATITNEIAPVRESVRSSRAVFDDYMDHSWRSNAQRQRDKGVEFVIGRREGAYLWNVEGSKQVIDCGTGGGVHSLGHRHPAVLAALQQALSESRDTGLWSVPNEDYLKLQALLAELAPHPSLNRSVVTLASTVSIDLAIMFAFRLTGRQRILVYRHGYHGHTGLACLATGSLDEGVIDYYNMPNAHTAFFQTYGDVDEIRSAVTDDIAAVILEPINYETFAPAPAEYLLAVQEACRAAGALFVLDETRSGLGRSGKLWAAEHYDIAPDMMVTGKGLSGGLYPVSALMLREELYDRCMNEHKFSYISSLGGNEISCVVAAEVMRLSSDPALHENVRKAAGRLEQRFSEIADDFPDTVRLGTVFGCMASIEVVDPAQARQLYRAVFDEGVLCHSVSVIEPAVLKYFPPLIIDAEIVDEIAAATRRAVARIAGGR
jgi:acetylornithine aminotransferase